MVNYVCMYVIPKTSNKKNYERMNEELLQMAMHRVSTIIWKDIY